MDTPERKPPGGMLHQLNDLLRNMAEALNEGAPVQRNPRPISAPTPPPAALTRVEAAREAKDKTSLTQKRAIGDSAEKRLERERQMRSSNASEVREQQKKRDAFERQQRLVQDADQARHDKRQIQARSAPEAKGGAPVAPVKPLSGRYGRFLRGSNKNIRDAIVLAEIIGPCRAENDWRGV